MKIKELHCTILQEIQDELTNKTLPIYYVNNSEDSINKNNGVFIWIGARDGYIGHDFCHYECIFHTYTSKKLSIEVHFGEKVKNLKLDNAIKNHKKEYSIKEDWKHDHGKSRIVCNKEITITYEDIKNTSQDIEITTQEIINITKDAIKTLKSLDKKIGKRLAQIVKDQYGNKVIRLNKQIFSPTNGKTSSAFRKRPEQINFNKKIYKCAHEQVEAETKQALEKKYNDQDGELNIVLTERKLKNIKPDILVFNNNKYDIYEVKPYKAPIDCIEEAIGQLFVYSYTLSSNTPKYPVNKLFIVGPTKGSSATDNFMEHIKKEYGLKNIAYISPAEIYHK